MRICIINDFRNTNAVLDYKRFPEAQILDAWIMTNSSEKLPLKVQSICVFFNYTKILETKSKEEAWKKVEELLANYNEWTMSEQEVLRQAIYG